LETKQGLCVQLHIAVFLFGLSDLALFSAHVLRDGMEVSGDSDRGGDLLTRGYSFPYGLRPLGRPRHNTNLARLENGPTR
jgi:hypothetical protein